MARFSGFFIKIHHALINPLHGRYAFLHICRSRYSDKIIFIEYLGHFSLPFVIVLLSKGLDDLFLWSIDSRATTDFFLIGKV
jgi:hypothetical protein